MRTGICFFWWPKLPQIKGWHQDQEASFGYSVNALAPTGRTFTNAPAVMYAKALYKPRDPETKSIEMLITNDQKEFREEKLGLIITETDPLTTADNKKLRSFTFFPKSKGDWEQVSYGEEGDFYLVFTISAHSKEAFDKANEAYRSLISHYKE